jgi:proline dehydrogenase
MRSLLLSASQSTWLRRRVPRYRFARRAVARFMPGETLEDALAAAQALEGKGLGTVFTQLGENITEAAAAAAVTDHYLGVLDRIRALGLRTQVSVKLTQLGLDLAPGVCYGNLRRIIEHAGQSSIVWIDMEASPYVEVTLELFRRARRAYPNVGICLQAYLYRTAGDLAALLSLGPAIRLVKHRTSPIRGRGMWTKTFSRCAGSFLVRKLGERACAPRLPRTISGSSAASRTSQRQPGWARTA